MEFASRWKLNWLLRIKAKNDSDFIRIFGKEQSYKLEIKGWIGAYESTRGRKRKKIRFSR